MFETKLAESSPSGDDFKSTTELMATASCYELITILMIILSNDKDRRLKEM